MRSYTEYRRELCDIPDARVGPRSTNPFDIFSNTITNPETRTRLLKSYGSPDNHIDLFPAAISEDNDGNKLLGRTFGCILAKTFEALREGDHSIMKMKMLLPCNNKENLRELPWQK